MSKHESHNFIPLDQAWSLKARFDVALPEFVDVERIGVNLQAIQRLCRLGGISHLRVIGESGDDTSNFTPNIAGYGEHGQATATKTGLKTIVPTHTENFERLRGFGEENRPPSLSWVNATINLNDVPRLQEILLLVTIFFLVLFCTQLHLYLN